MAKNYTLNVALNMSATTATGYSQSQSGAYALNITGVDQIATGRIDCATGSDATIMAAPGYGKAVYVRNLDDANVLEVYGNASSENDLLGVLKAGEFMFTVLRDTDTVTARGLGGTVTAEYFAVEIDANA